MILISSFSLSLFVGTILLMIFLPAGAVVVLVVVAVGRFCFLFLPFVGVSRDVLFYQVLPMLTHLWNELLVSCRIQRHFYGGRGGWLQMEKTHCKNVQIQKKDRMEKKILISTPKSHINSTVVPQFYSPQLDYNLYKNRHQITTLKLLKDTREQYQYPITHFIGGIHTGKQVEVY